ncbi:dTDP-4-dehydrorhamnose 3,5-epimerase [Litoribacter ruber]|uniref:dTDP-4-dehydrorhamnose 3,5-epimerase n=1 Tax=Litoribacter ruber TaxID=702568 RepID=A0AAP2CFH2_9BACT|nr:MULTISPECIES: dTDP-4-dehydrorhamnose 3,5-epimerase [Litoribacter]MBS9523608.1 dTDP-4-dehydrorhamnose 3,5-epimerase [Litoribacter alkaliphilus]MBT0811988.1 dTDP-4-dehydrorhamnose 3,5-epimerase [Litoribacter ruber]
MKIIKTNLEGCFEIDPDVIGDERGYFYESFNVKTFEKVTGIKPEFVQDNQSKSKKGVFRGLHFQAPPFAQAKLVRVISGEVLDVAVDIRKGSPTFGQHHAVVLSAENKKQFYLPRGFAHGFLVLSESAEFFYKCDNYYNQPSDGGIYYNDPSLKIDWQMDESEILLSEKDRNLPMLGDFESPFEY